MSFFSKLSEYLYQYRAPYQFKKKATSYDKGYLKVSDWTSELCYHYEQKRKAQDKAISEEFRGVLEARKQEAEDLASSEYKNGLLQAFRDIERFGQ